MLFVTDWTAWLSFGFILLLLELFISGVFLMWWGFAAIITAILCVFIPYMDMSWQVIIFSLLAVIFSLIWWKFQKMREREDILHNKLNAREHHLIGKIGVIVDILPDGIIRAKFGDSTWKVEGENLAIGDKVQVLRVDGIILFVRKA